MKNLKFHRHLAEEIVEGRKTVTWRLFDDKDLKTGDKIELVIWESEEKFSNAKITEVREKRLGEIQEQDFEGHEKFVSKKEMLETYRKYYGDRVDWNTVVKIIKGINRGAELRIIGARSARAFSAAELRGISPYSLTSLGENENTKTHFHFAPRSSK